MYYKTNSTLMYGVLALLLIIVASCNEESIELASENAVLTLSTEDEFDNLVRFSMEATEEEKESYTSALKFKSLYSIMKEVEQAEDELLESLLAKYDPDTPRPREYALITHHYLNKGVLRLDEFGIPELNITVPAFSIFLNEDRQVAIGGENYQFAYDKVTVLDPDDESIVSISPAERIIRPAKTKDDNAKSCSDTEGKYKLITYENNLIWSMPGGLPCPDSRFSHWLKLRSLKKFLGSWYNHKTTALRVKGSVRISHYKKDILTGTREFITYMVNDNNYFYNLPEGHTEEKYFVQDYPLRYGKNNECIEYYINFDYTNHTGIGKNSTSCSL